MSDNPLETGRCFFFFLTFPLFFQIEKFVAGWVPRYSKGTKGITLTAFVWPWEHEAQRGEGACPAPSLSVEDTCCPHPRGGAHGQQSRSLASPTPGRASQDARRPGHASAPRAWSSLRGARGRTTAPARTPVFSWTPQFHVFEIVTMALNPGLAGAEFSWGRRGASGLPARARPVGGRPRAGQPRDGRAPSPGGDGQ